LTTGADADDDTSSQAAPSLSGDAPEFVPGRPMEVRR
jgi:hypothetical protein